MKAKLHKMVSGYILSLNGDIDDPYAIANEELAKDYEWYKLSLKNCQAIERGYDLDELLDNISPKNGTTGNISERIGFVKGFQKAIELMGDKKFSEEDMKRIYEKGYSSGRSELNSRESDKIKYDYIQSLQQTEWDVEIVMNIDNPCPKCGETENVHGNYDYSQPDKPLINTLCNECGAYFLSIPKLDADGCLILKRI